MHYSVAVCSQRIKKQKTEGEFVNAQQKDLDIYCNSDLKYSLKRLKFPWQQGVLTNNIPFKFFVLGKCFLD